MKDEIDDTIPWAKAASYTRSQLFARISSSDQREPGQYTSLSTVSSRHATVSSQVTHKHKHRLTTRDTQDNTTTDIGHKRRYYENYIQTAFNIS